MYIICLYSESEYVVRTLMQSTTKVEMMIDLFLLLSRHHHAQRMLFVVHKSIPSCHVTCESPEGSFDPVKDPEPAPEQVLAERVQKTVAVTRHVSSGTNTEEMAEQVTAATNTEEMAEHKSSSTNTESSEHVSSSTNTESSNTRYASSSTNTESSRHVSSSTNTEQMTVTNTVIENRVFTASKDGPDTDSYKCAGTNTVTEHVSMSTNTPPYNAEQAIISNKLEVLSNSIQGYKETRERVDTIRDLHQALNQAKTLNLLLRQRLKENRHECNLLMNSNAHLPPVDPLYQAVWMAGVFPQDKFVLFYRQNSQRIQLLYIQYLYKFGGSESEVCHSYGFQLFLREYLGCATNIRPMVSRGGTSSSSTRVASSRMSSKDRYGSGGTGTTSTCSRVGSRGSSRGSLSEVRSESRGHSRDSQLWCLEE